MPEQDDAFFAIIVGEVTDVHANQEVLTVCLHFLDKLNPEQPEAKEVSFDFVYLDKTDCESISRAIIQCLYKRGIDTTKARGRAYDGAFAMSSSRVALCVHCNSHVLNLSVASSCQIQAIKNVIYTINKL